MLASGLREVAGPDTPEGAVRVHLWVFNNLFQGISEQVEFFCTSLRDHGFRPSVSRSPVHGALNVVIENFTPESAAQIARFCADTGKRVGVILTEHIDLLYGRLFFHGRPLSQRDEYMHSVTKTSRITNLLLLRDQISVLLRLGDLPRLRNFEQVMPGVPIRTIPFPSISPTDRALPGEKAQYDFVFTGILTAYRRKVLKTLSKSFSVYVPQGHGAQNLVSRRRRDAINAQAKLVLNIPQSSEWQWVSPMRVLAALRCRRVTVTFRSREKTLIDPICLFSDYSKPRLSDEIRSALEEPESCFHEKLKLYNVLVHSSENSFFPQADLRLWARLEL
jgi:hypothetical protein